MNKNQILSRQLNIVKKEERAFLNRKENVFVENTLSPISKKIEARIPQKLRSTLNLAFYKGFQLLFEKGNVYIEKTYNRDKIQLEHDLNNYAVDRYISGEHLKIMDKNSLHSNIINGSIALVEGGVLGAFGIGLPDIPLFLAVIIRTINEVSLSYGYHYDSDTEKAYMMYIICAAMSKGDMRNSYNYKINLLGKKIDSGEAVSINLEEIMKEASDLLSELLVTAKFIQGLPFVGVLGGLTNPVIIHKIGSYAKLKYKRRYLLCKLRISKLESTI